MIHLCSEKRLKHKLDEENGLNSDIDKESVYRHANCARNGFSNRIRLFKKIIYPILTENCILLPILGPIFLIGFRQ